MMAIRPAEPDDAPAIRHVHKAAFGQDADVRQQRVEDVDRLRRRTGGN